MEMTPPPTAEQRTRILRVFKVTRPECGKQFCIYRTWADVEDGEFHNGAELGQTIQVTLENMTKEELDNLPDFSGW
jgi:hypothetical protein